MIIELELEKALWKFIKEYSCMYNDFDIQEYIMKNRERYVEYPTHVLGDYILMDPIKAEKIKEYFSSWMLDYFERQERFSMFLQRLEKKENITNKNDYEILPDDSFLDEDD